MVDLATACKTLSVDLVNNPTEIEHINQTQKILSAETERWKNRYQIIEVSMSIFKMSVL